MMHWERLILAAAAAVCGAACQSSSTVSCSLSGGTELADAPWPKFRADAANSGRTPTNVDLNGSTGSGTLVFDGRCSVSTQQTCFVDADPTTCPTGESCVQIGSVSATPILGLTMHFTRGEIFVASTDGNVYIVDNDGQFVTIASQIHTGNAIVGSPLLGADGTLFVPSSGELAQFFADGAARNIAAVPGFISGSPNIWSGDGTAFIGTQAGAFVAVCPNGVPRFSVSFPSTQSTAALVPDPNMPNENPQKPIIIAGGFNGQVRAYTIRGRQYWSFFATANIVAAVMIDPLTDIFYVADSAGNVFAANVADGRLITPPFSFAAAAAITASPALGRDDTTTTPPQPGKRMYVADQGGRLYALDRATGEPLWDVPFQADGPISSSPAVATGGSTDVIVVAADILGSIPGSPAPVAIDGRVYAVRDDGTHATKLWTFDAGHAIGPASPAVGADGTVYIGRQGTRLGMPSECPNVDVDGDGTQDACVVNDGGALYAINS